MKLSYDVFISYAHGDLEFARKLNDSLNSRGGCRTFFDEKSLRAGDDWEARLRDAVEKARNLIVLWSDLARQSDWVSQEYVTFQLTANPRTDPGRRLIFVNLQGMNQAMKSFQQVVSPVLQGVYPDVAKVDDVLWSQVMRDVREGLDPQRRPLEVPLVLLTLTQRELDGLSADNWDEINTNFELSDASLRPRYGVTRDDWRPFNGTETIGTLLEAVAKEVNDALPDYQLSWKRPEERFWTDIGAARAYVAHEFETGELSALIVDPIALHARPVYQRLMLFQDSLARSRAIVLPLPPFAVPGHIIRLRTALMDLGTPYFDEYFQPAIPPRRRLAAQCGWNVADVGDVKRLILTAAGQLAVDNEPKTSSIFLRHGARR